MREANPCVREVIDAYNADPNRPFDMIGGVKSYYRARLPIFATDCDYEIVSISGVQGKCRGESISQDGGGV